MSIHLESADLPDPLAVLFPKYRFEARVFFSGRFCGSNTFAAENCGHVHMLKKGKLVMEHGDGTQIHATGPCVIFYPSPCFHRLAVLDEEAELVCATIAFMHPAHNPIRLAFPPCWHVELGETPQLTPIFDLLFNESSRSDLGKRAALDWASDLAILGLIRCARSRGVLRPGTLAGLCDESLGPTLRNVLLESGRAWTIAELAEISGMSRAGFISNFKRVVGTSPGGFLMKWRVSIAQELLAAGESVSAVAAAVGYTNQPAFSRAFIASFGVPPSDWKRQNLQLQAK